MRTASISGGTPSGCKYVLATASGNNSGNDEADAQNHGQGVEQNRHYVLLFSFKM